jgi:6-phosphogluconolactonase
MRVTRYAWLGVAALVLLGGCKGFWDATTTTTGGSGTFPASGVFYVLNAETKQIAGYQFAANSNGPTAVTGSLQTIAALPFTMAVTPTGNFLYVSTVTGIYVYSVGSGGALTIANSGQVISQDTAFAMQVDSTGTWLVEVVSGQGTVNAVPISASSGLFDSTRSERTAALPTVTIKQLAVSPANSANPYVFVAMGSGGTAVVPFTATNTASNTSPFGTVSLINLINTAGGANAVAVDPANRLLYVGETVATAATSTGQTGGLRVFTIGANSAINQITGSPYSTGGTGPSAIMAGTLDVYVANMAVSGSTDGNVTAFSLTSTGTSTTTFALTAINTLPAGINTVALGADSTATYLLAANSGGSPDLTTFTFDATTTGKLVAAANVTTGTDPVDAVSVVGLP